MAAELSTIISVFVIASTLYITHCKVVIAPKVRLNDGHDIPAIALGTWLGNRTQPTGTEVYNAVKWALAAGYRHVDTASAYQVEDQVGAALREVMEGGLKREDIFVTTKLFNDEHRRDAVLPALRHSLQKLGLEYVDLYLIHWPVGQFRNRSYDYTDYLDTWRGLMEAKELGLTRSIGLSNFNQQQIQRILDNGLETPAALQVEINLNLQQPALLSYCRALNITVLGYTPFGSLFSSKGGPDAPPPRADDPQLVAIAHKYNKTVPQIVLRYLTQLDVVPLPKSLTKSRIEQNLDIFDFSLSQEERQILQGFDKNYRTIPQLKWADHPYYPFEKNTTV